MPNQSNPNIWLQVYFCIQTLSNTNWGDQDRLLQVLAEEGFSIIDMRTHHPLHQAKAKVVMRYIHIHIPFVMLHHFQTNKQTNKQTKKLLFPVQIIFEAYIRDNRLHAPPRIDMISEKGKEIMKRQRLLRKKMKLVLRDKSAKVIRYHINFLSKLVIDLIA
jgi:hypothetical protein